MAKNISTGCGCLILSMALLVGYLAIKFPRTWESNGSFDQNQEPAKEPEIHEAEFTKMKLVSKSPFSDDEEKAVRDLYKGSRFSFEIMKPEPVELVKKIKSFKKSFEVKVSKMRYDSPDFKIWVRDVKKFRDKNHGKVGLASAHLLMAATASDDLLKNKSLELCGDLIDEASSGVINVYMLE